MTTPHAGATQLDHTHDVNRRSWVASSQEPASDFPIQNLPFAVFRRAGSDEAFRGGVAIGDQIVCMAALSRAGCLEGVAAQAAAACAQPALNAFLAMGPAAWRSLRHALFALLEDSAAQSVRDQVSACLMPQAEAEYTLPTVIGDYTDFYTSIDHATNIGKLKRPDAPLSPNFQWIPIAYHGRVSTIGVSGQQVRRPIGQRFPAGATAPVLDRCGNLDYELELGIYVGPGNPQGDAIALEDAADHIFGICLLNDWSARDIQFWEMAPLGPFHAKNFATTISPWIVTLDALAPYRTAWNRPADHPQPLAYLDAPAEREAGALDVQLEVALATPSGAGKEPQRLSRTSFRHQYWTIAQMLTHHAVGGCAMRPGDLLGSGTISGPTPEEAGALIELSRDGTAPVALPNGETRTFLEDGDTVILRGWCERPGYARIGMGECRGTVTPARDIAQP